MQYLGTYGGIVIASDDPAQVGRVKVRVPTIHGAIQSTYEIIADADLPWALPAGTPAGNSPGSGGLSHIPLAGDQVWVRFLDGELEKPVYEWGNQNLAAVKNYPSGLPLHAYDSDGTPTARCAWMKYSNTREITPAGIEDITYGQYKFVMADSTTPTSKDGSISWTTANGYYTSLDDTSNSYTVVAPNFYAITSTISFFAMINCDITTPLINLDFGRMCFVGDYGGHIIDGISRTVFGVQGIFQSLGLTAVSTIGIGAPNFFIASNNILFYPDGTPITPAVQALGTNLAGQVWLATGGPTDGLVRQSDLTLALQSIKDYIMVHTHGGVQGGSSVTSPPIQIPIFDATASATVSAEAATQNFYSV